MNTLRKKQRLVEKVNYFLGRWWGFIHKLGYIMLYDIICLWIYFMLILPCCLIVWRRRRRIILVTTTTSSIITKAYNKKNNRGVLSVIKFDFSLENNTTYINTRYSKNKSNWAFFRKLKMKIQGVIVYSFSMRLLSSMIKLCIFV